MEKLLPCPFCGSKQTRYCDESMTINCSACGTQGPYRSRLIFPILDSETAAIDAWNRRSPAPSADLGKLFHTLAIAFHDIEAECFEPNPSVGKIAGQAQKAMSIMGDALASLPKPLEGK